MDKGKIFGERIVKERRKNGKNMKRKLGRERPLKKLNFVRKRKRNEKKKTLQKKRWQRKTAKRVKKQQRIESKRRREWNIKKGRRTGFPAPLPEDAVASSVDPLVRT